MKLIKAYIRTFMAEKVIDALLDIGTPHLSAIDVRELRDEVDPSDLQISMEYGTKYTKMVKLELICADSCLKKATNTILQHARTGHSGDGIIAVTNIEQLIKIKTGTTEEEKSIRCKKNEE